MKDKSIESVSADLYAARHYPDEAILSYSSHPIGDHVWESYVATRDTELAPAPQPVRLDVEHRAVSRDTTLDEESAAILNYFMGRAALRPLWKLKSRLSLLAIFFVGTAACVIKVLLASGECGVLGMALVILSVSVGQLFIGAAWAVHRGYVLLEPKLPTIVSSLSIRAFIGARNTKRVCVFGGVVLASLGLALGGLGAAAMMLRELVAPWSFILLTLSLEFLVCAALFHLKQKRLTEDAEWQAYPQSAIAIVSNESREESDAA